MYLKRLYIKNYRSIRDLDIPFARGKNVIVGRNNAGKSNIVKALDVIFGENVPTYAKGDSITEQDFYCWKEDGEEESEIVRLAQELFIWCELERESSEELNFEELYDGVGFGFYVYRGMLSRNDLPQCYESIFEIPDESDTPRRFVNPKFRHEAVLEKEFGDKLNFAYAFYARRSESGQVHKEMRFLYRKDGVSDWIMAFRTPIRTELLQSAIIPSFRDPQNQLRLTKWSWFGKLIKGLTEQGMKSPELLSAFEQVRSVGDGIFQDLKDKVTKTSLNVAFPGTELQFQFNMDAGPDLFKNCVIYIDDGYKSPLTEKGSGIQSATIIGLFSYYTQYVCNQKSALLCVEEPELYLHPHARRVISDRLDDFLQGNRHQVVLTTHSIEFVRTALQDLNVILVRKGNGGTEIRSVRVNEYKSLLIDNNQNELFFADKVILCEGLDDHIVRAMARELYSGCLDEQNVSILSVAGKDNLGRLAKLVTRLGIKCFIIADFDYLLRDKQEERRKYNAEAHDCVLNLGEAFMNQDCIFGHNNGGRKAYSYIEKLRNELKQSSEELFYTAKKAEQFDNEKLARALKVLRNNGICILSGEIEHLSKDTRFLSPTNKLTLQKVYELNSRLNSGAKMIELFETEELHEFLRTVFER